MSGSERGNTPKVSVIMNCYNSSLYLREAIDSVYSQTYKDWEIIFWDNASTDNSAEIAKSYDGRLVYFKGEKTIPLGAARNLAIAKAAGKYIAFLDCDDMWLSKKLEKQIGVLENSPEIDFIHSNCYALKMSDGSKRLMFKNIQPQGNVFRSQLASYAVNMLTAVIRKTVLDGLPSLFEEKLQYCEEYDLFLRIFYRSKISYIDEPLAVYRIHQKMTTNTMDFEQIMRETEYVIEKLSKMYPDFDEKYSKELLQVMSNIAFFTARDRLYKAELFGAREKIKPYKSLNIKYMAVYTASFLPAWLWTLLSKLRKGLKGNLTVK